MNTLSNTPTQEQTSIITERGPRASGRSIRLILRAVYFASAGVKVAFVTRSNTIAHYTSRRCKAVAETLGFQLSGPELSLTSPHSDGSIRFYTLAGDFADIDADVFIFEHD